jgi:hypothetical protein
MSDYFVGSDILGAEGSGDPFEVLGAANPKGPFVTIHVKNVPELVKKEGGGAGEVAFQLLPQTIENTVYSKMKAEIAAGMKEKGVDADVNVVSNLPAVGGSPKDFLVGSVVGAAAVGLVLGLAKLIKRR